MQRFYGIRYFKCLNKSLIETLIRGGSVSLGTYLGTYQVQRAVARESVDWAASFRLRDEMIAAGIEVQSFLNPYGKNWKVKSDNPYYWFCKWIRHRMGVDVINIILLIVILILILIVRLLNIRQ